MSVPPKIVLCIKNLLFNQFTSIHRKKSLGGGTVLNIGVYSIQFCQWIFQQAPKSIQILNALVNDDGVDVDILAEIRYGNDSVAKIRHSFVKKQNMRAKIIGTNGELIVSVIVCNFFLKIMHYIDERSSFSRCPDLFVQLQLLILMELKRLGHYQIMGQQNTITIFQILPV